MLAGTATHPGNRIIFAAIDGARLFFPGGPVFIWSGTLVIISIAFLYNASNVIPVVTPVWPMVAKKKHISSRVIDTGTSPDTHLSIACTAERC
jgi:hypothetical protein